MGKKNILLYKILICFLMPLLFLQCGCYRQEEHSIDLEADGYIKIGGGCYVYLTGEITFKPQDDNIVINIDNSGGYFTFYSTSRNLEPFDKFETVLSAKKAKEFFVKIKSLLDVPQPPKQVSTTDLTVEIYLSLQSETIHTKWQEVDGKFDVYPLGDEIVEFVANCVYGKYNPSISDPK